MNAVWGLVVLVCMGVSGYDYEQCKYEEVKDTAVIVSVVEAPDPAYGFEVTYRLEQLKSGERALRPASCPYVCAEDIGRYNIRVGATFPAMVKRRVSGSCPELVVKFPSLRLQGAGTMHAGRSLKRARLRRCCAGVESSRMKNTRRPCHPLASGIHTRLNDRQLL